MGSKLVLFDIDGTLVNSGDIIFAALTRTMVAFGMPEVPRVRALKVVGLSLFEAFLDLTGNAAQSAAMADHYKGLFGDLRASGDYPEPLYPDAESIVQALRAQPDVRLGIATGKSLRGVNHLLERLRWEGWFATVQTADYAPSKPHPAMIHQAMAESGVGPARTVMIGDSVHDMRMARAAGVRALAVSWGFHPAADLLAAGADHVVNHFAEVPAAIDALIS